LSKQYFIRIRGTVRGPFAAEKLKELARRGQFSRVHHVSLDGVNWEPAANHPELLPEAKAVNIHKRSINTEDHGSGYELAATDEQTADTTAANESGTQNDRDDRAAWHYASAGRQIGPVSFAELRQLASRGALQFNDPVWSEGMSDWTEAANVPGLFVKTAVQHQESTLPAVAAQSPTWHQPVGGSGTKVVAALAGGALGLLFLVLFALWLFMTWERTDAESPEVGCAACGTVMTLLVFLSIAIVVLNIALLVWVARDAKARGMDSAVVWMLLVMFTGLLGLLIYVFSRPQGNVVPCPMCGNKRLHASARCPHCGNP